jgi:hypothetical protein
MQNAKMSVAFPILGHSLLDIVRTMDEKRIIAIARNLIDRITTNFAGIQMVHDIELFVKIQLLIEQQH